MKIRAVKTASNTKAVQVVRYHENKRKVLHHIGSAHNEDDLKFDGISRRMDIRL